MKFNIEKLQLNPGDIVVVTVKVDPRLPRTEKRIQKIHAELRKVLPSGQRSVCKYDDVSIGLLADIVTPEELHRLNEVMEKRMLASANATQPHQKKEP